MSESIISETDFDKSASPIQQFIRWIYPNQDDRLNLFVGKTNDVSGVVENRETCIVYAEKLKNKSAVNAVWMSVNRLKPNTLNCDKIKAESVQAYQFFSIDIDADIGVKGRFAASASEHAETLDLANTIIETFADELPTPLLVDTGNGHLLLYPIDLPHTDENRQLIRSTLRAVQNRFDSNERFIDLKVSNPDRVFGVVGTVNRNKLADETSGRIHRMRQIVGKYPSRQPMSAERFIEWANGLIEKLLKPNGKRLKSRMRALSTTWTCQSSPKSKIDRPIQLETDTILDHSEIVSQCRQFLMGCEPSIEGSGGNNQAFKVAGKLIASGLSVDETTALLISSGWNDRCSPPWHEWELQRIVESASRNGSLPAPIEINKPFNKVSASIQLDSEIEDCFGDDFSDSPTTKNYPLSDIGNAEHFADSIREKSIFIPTWKTWLHFDGKRWRRDETDRIRRFALKHIRHSMPKFASMIRDDETRSLYLKWASQCQSESRINAMISLASSILAIDHSRLDRNGNFFNLANGTLEIDSMKFREHRATDFLTKISTVDYVPNAISPLWKRTIDRIFQGQNGQLRDELLEFVQRAVGYSLTTDDSAQCFFVLYGNGRNGKTTFIDTVKLVMGDYAMSGLQSLLLASDSKFIGKNSDDEAELFGRRFVSISETDSHHSFAESKIKRIVGGGTITAMRKFERPFSFEPTHKIWLDCNHKPKVKNNDDGIWRRIKLIPFETQIGIDERDEHLAEKLKAESSGILNWALDGLRKWQADGRKLLVPNEVVSATEGYRNDSDIFGQFIDECLNLNESDRTATSEVYQRYLNWTESNGMKFKLTKIEFGKRMNERGLKSKVSNSKNYFIGCSLAEPNHFEDAVDERPF